MVGGGRNSADNEPWRKTLIGDNDLKVIGHSESAADLIACHNVTAFGVSKLKVYFPRMTTC